MELRVLRYFLGVAREGSITGAAQTLNVTQPTLSRQLKDLEDELGQKLFRRGSHHVSLTPEGMLLRKRAEEIMEMVHKTESEFGSMGENVSGDIHIGCGESEAMRQIVEILRALREEYPEIKFHLFSGNADDVMERLDKGILDFGVLIQPVDISKYDHLALPVKDVWGLVMRRDNPLAAQEAIERKDLADIPLLCSRQILRPGGVWNPCVEWLGGKVEKLNIVATYNLIYNASLMVEAGVGSAIGLDKLVNATNLSHLCFRPFAPRLESGLDIVWKKYQVFPEAAGIFLEKLQEKFPSC